VHDVKRSSTDKRGGAPCTSNEWGSLIANIEGRELEKEGRRCKELHDVQRDKQGTVAVIRASCKGTTGATGYAVRGG